MNRNTIIGLVLIFGIFIAYSYFMMPSKEEVAKQQQRSDSLALVMKERRDSAIRTNARRQALENLQRVEEQAEKGEVIDSTEVLRMEMKDQLGRFSNAAFGEEKFYTVETDLLKLRINAKGGRIEQVELKKYKTWEKNPTILLNTDSLHFGFSFFSGNRLINTERLYFQPAPTGNTGQRKDSICVTGQDSIHFAMRLYPDGGETDLDRSRYIECLFTFYGDKYMIGYQLNFQGMEEVIDPSTNYLVLNWKENLTRQEKSLKMERMNTTVYYKYLEDKVDYLSETKDEEKFLKNEKIRWVSFKQQFFLTTLIADTYFAEPRIQIQTLPFEGNYLKTMVAEIGIPFSSRETTSIPMRLYIGPNKYYTLRKYRLDMEKQIPLGWSFFLMAWINQYAVIPVFTFFGSLGWNYGIIILILTIMLKIVLFPIAYKTYKSSAKMRVLKPDIDEISKKFPKKEDAMKKQQATMDLYKRAGVNPLAGCVPMLLQFPILIAMFRFFPSSIELRQQPFLWATDLSSYDSIWTFPGGFSIPFYGNHISLFALLMTLSSILYTKVNEQMMTGTQQQMPGMKVMMYLMPVMFLFWFNDYSSGLSYYYLLANLLTFAQILLIRRTIDEKKLHAQIEANKKKTAKKSGFQKRLENMAKKRGYPVKR
ncbi:MAG: membrane protein insertase YidC [Bacteroidetes bacterium]|nr:MAG: membrane protein insertase YidC [Bacteroidota bacterium]